MDLSVFSKVIKETYFKNMSVGVDLRIIAPEYIPFNLDFIITTDLPYVEQQSLLNSINDFVINLFEPKNLEFGSSIYSSAIIAQILSNFKAVKSILPGKNCTNYIVPNLSQFIYLSYLSITVDRG